jgi:hypothetical protein
MTRTLLRLIAPTAAAVLLSACNGILSGIYDEPETPVADGFGFQSGSTMTQAGTLYIDATDYKVWTYINFHSMTAEARAVDAEAPTAWDIAIHRYDAKTNGASVIETAASGFGAQITPEGEFVSDVFTTDKIVTDMSTMMDGYLSYAESDYNPELSKWLNVDMSTMPPVYTPSRKVYLIKFTDATHAAVLLDNYMDDTGVKGFMTIKYIYPYIF